MLNHPLVRSLKNLQGNARGCVYTEPLWGIPYNLYAPYVSIYMLSLGLKDSQIGLIVTIGSSLQILMALLSGAITDKLGRKKTTFIFDIISWSIPVLIWAAAQNFTYFVVAAIINSIWRITMNSWSCLLVEDTDPKLLIDVYSWINISGLLSAFFAPLAGLLINQYTLVPTMRGLYLFAFVMMTVKFLVMNGMVTETQRGVVRMQETKDQGIFSMLGEYRGVFLQILRTPRTLLAVAISLSISVPSVINSTFWSVLVTEKILIPAEHISLYPTVRSMALLLFYFFVMPRIARIPFRIPMTIGFASLILSQLLLLNAPEKSYLILMLNTLVDACSLAALGTLMERLMVLAIDPKERARINAIIYVVVILFTSPFGWIAGILSEMNRILPFALNMGIYFAGLLLVFLSTRLPQVESEELDTAALDIEAA
jgi:MFS family permease